MKHFFLIPTSDADSTYRVKLTQLAPMSGGFSSLINNPSKINSPKHKPSSLNSSSSALPLPLTHTFFPSQLSSTSSSLVVLLSLALSLMGNYISCTLSTTHGKHSRGAKVIFPSGEFRQFDGPVKAAELMFETPNYFLVNSQSLQIGRRFSALNADEDLEMGNVYVMFPMKRVNSIVTTVDMGVLLMTANSVAKRTSGGKVRISPDSGSGAARVRPVSAINNSHESGVPLSRLKLDDTEDLSLPEFRHRLSMCRSRKPLLETITEEPVCSR